MIRVGSRWLATAMIFLTAVVGVTGCSAAPAAAQAWHHGELAIATGNTTGVYYQVGGGYADLITRHLPGYEAVAAPTNGSADNLRRLSTGDVQVAISLADVAADAVRGTGDFAGQPIKLRALARVYSNYTHLVVRADAHIHTLADLRGKRISTGTPNSGTEMMAKRLLATAGLDPDQDVYRKAWSLTETTNAMLKGQLDALFWSGGLPTLGISDLFRKAPGRFVFLPLDGALPALERAYPGVYTAASIDRSAYGLPADVPTIAVANVLVVDPDMPDGLAYDLTRVLFEYHAELAEVHPEARNITRDKAPETDPVPLHPGAARYYAEG
ncbi:MAG TPA: TAXI family TRAP transporter solute-binding subunit [Micromonosporaceae bacterium]